MVGLPLYLSEDTFDVVLISVGIVPESESSSMAGRLRHGIPSTRKPAWSTRYFSRVLCERRVLAVITLVKPKAASCQCRDRQARTASFVRHELDLGLIDRDASRISTIPGL